MPRGAQGFSWLLEVTVSLAFLTDVIFSFRTAYESNGSWVTSHDAIARNYMSFWFWIDAPSSVPLELLDLLVDTSHLSIMRLLRLFRLLRLIKILKINEIIERLEDEVRPRHSYLVLPSSGRGGYDP